MMNWYEKLQAEAEHTDGRIILYGKDLTDRCREVYEFSTLPLEVRRAAAAASTVRML